MVELASAASDTADEAIDRLLELRRAAIEIAESNGLRVAGAGSHPTSVPEEQEIAGDERYRDFVEYAGSSARRQGVSGLHVHVGMPDADTCFRVMETILPWLPLVLALSANSPYLAGRETGMLSTRAEVLGLLPRRGAPPAFRDYAGWEAFIERDDGDRAREGLHEFLVGRTSASAVRHARDSRSGPAHVARADRRVRAAC